MSKHYARQESMSTLPFPFVHVKEYKPNKGYIKSTWEHQRNKRNHNGFVVSQYTTYTTKNFAHKVNKDGKTIRYPVGDMVEDQLQELYAYERWCKSKVKQEGHVLIRSVDKGDIEVKTSDVRQSILLQTYHYKDPYRVEIPLLERISRFFEGR